MPHHLQPVDPDPTEEEPGPFGEPEDELAGLRRASWWRWVALLVIVAMVVATPFAYALYQLFR